MYSRNYLVTSGSLWNYCRDQLADDTTEDNNNPNKNVIKSKSFKYKTNIDETNIGNGGNPAPNRDYNANKSDTKEVEVAVPWKNLGNFWNSLSTPLVNREVPLALNCNY